MAKADTLGKQTLLKDGTGTSLRDYTSLLGVVAAGILGMSLLCITSAIALSAPNQPTPIVLGPGSIVDLAVNNINTVSALTVQALSTISFEETPILLPSRTPTSSPTVTASAFVVAPTQRQPTRTREPRIPPTSTPRPPTRTAIPLTRTSAPPTNTNVPPTVTPIPDTPTSIPDSPTPVPPTATSEPPTSEPPTATSEPPTSAPPPSDTPGVPEPIVNSTPTAGP